MGGLITENNNTEQFDQEHAAKCPDSVRVDR